MKTSWSRGFAAAGLLALLLCAGCVSDPAAGDARKLETTLSAYHSALRWNGIDAALALHDPESLKTEPVTSFERERWAQFRVVGYRDSTPVPVSPGRVQQRVALELMNVNTQSVRTLLDVQEWRWDAEAKRWWLTSGLPSLDPK